MLTGEQVQRLGSHIAFIRPAFDAVLREVVEKVGTAFPAARPAMTPGTRQDRYVLAACVAMIAKNLGDFDSMRPHLVAWGRGLSDRGFDAAAAAPLAGRALLNAIKEASGDSWSAQIEADYKALIAACFEGLAQGAARRLGTLRIAA